MRVALKLPRVSMNMEEATVTRWHKQPGEAFAAGEALYSIETEKTSRPSVFLSLCSFRTFDSGSKAHGLLKPGNRSFGISAGVATSFVAVVFDLLLIGAES